MRILLTGATGLVGQGVLHELLANDTVTHVGVLGRTPVDTDDARVTNIVVAAFDALGDAAGRLAGYDACLYCAGAPPWGTPERDYRHVTVDLTLSVARAFASANPSGRFLYISGAGADPASRWMPMRAKGEAEQQLRALPIATVMLRPGGIAPVHAERSPHAALRAVYALGAPVMAMSARWIPSVMTTTAAVGRAMLALASRADPPTTLENADINRLGG